MGSLMAGWSSPKLSKKASNRNPSNTKEEIINWKKKQGLEEKAFAASSKTAGGTSHLQKWNSFGGSESKTEELFEAVKSKDWWRKTNVSHLNDRPDELVDLKKTKSKFTSQNHIGNKSSAYIHSNSMPSGHSPALQ
ncbi:hypothetical protein O6H91_01G085400 [Diphasiastrum complanatum]|uniref:Uncharacterized protein n=1 Tax=Diphasiastrum complanatum TaxID=34168 RepID=A0ACC2ESN3_DIPCM|nr:hypothetical protein O6H91_01G085400 [Diphasiastrum complanatum]